MSEPASPLPWKRDVRAPRFLYRRDGYNLGNFLHPQDAGYALHAANCFPALLAALKKLIEASMLPVECVHDQEPDYCDGCRYAMEKAVQMARIHARAAIASADPGTGDRE